MPNDKKLPATVPTKSSLPLAQSSGLVARGLAVQQSLAAREKEDAKSLFKKGMRYRYGEGGTPQDDEKARTHLLAAAKLNHAEAQFELSCFLREYDEGPDAAAWLERSVSQGFGPAQRFLGEFLSEPWITERLTNADYSESQLYQQACRWYEERATAGDAEAQYDLVAWILRNPEATPNYSREKAMVWMRAAAEQDHGFACIRLGESLLEENEPKHNVEQGIYFLSRAADLGRSLACQILGDLYLLGHNGGLSARGSVSQIIAPDKRLAVSWYERGIELDRELGAFSGAYSLARLYLIGDHLDQDLALAERMLVHTANAGDLSSQRQLASEYTSGKRLKRDASAALHWLKMAEQNNSSSKRVSQYQLGYFYEHDNDDSPNYAEAITWYRKGADEGDYRSQKSLGDIYEAGKGVPKDYVEAFKWYLLSAANSYGKSGIINSHTAALRLRDLLARKMTASQLYESRQLAREWMDQTKAMPRPLDYEFAREWLDNSAS